MCPHCGASLLVEPIETRVDEDGCRRYDCPKCDGKIVEDEKCLLHKAGA